MSKILFTPERIEDHLLWLESYLREKRELQKCHPSPFDDTVTIHFLDNIHTMLVDYQDYVNRFEGIHFNDIGG